MKPKILGEFICVLDNGFVYHGDVSEDETYYLIFSAQNIRKYGTEKGLGQLRNGVTPQTVLDPCGEVMVPKGRLCHFIKASWHKV